MSAVLARHRLTFRAAVATAALAGALLTPAVAFAADGPSGADTHCTATQTIPAAFGGWTVDLTNDLSAGPKAVLKDDNGKTVSTVVRAHTEDLANGLRIKDADTTSPLFLDRSQGDPAPWRTTPFPALPTDCLNTGTGTDSGSGTGSGSDTGTGTGTGTGTVTGKCTVLQTIPSRFGGWTVDLTNDLSTGPKAVLKDDEGNAVSSVDRSHPEDTVNGLKIEKAYSTAPLFLDNNQGGDSPWRTTPFPKLPKGCLNTGTGTGTAKHTGTVTARTTTGTAKHTGTVTAQAPTATQTKVVPTGAVAAGAEGTGSSQNTALLTGGAALAAGGAIGLGHVVRRRRVGV
ncbi:hypothetical protein [Streptomyces griseoluteus]|uniref:hypothetical protein n=1 Tax=Streptomyces griseoluteus TaxID=29306 RepID=UPI003827879B